MKAKKLAEMYRYRLSINGGNERPALAHLLQSLCQEIIDLCEKRGGSRIAVNEPVFKGAWNEVNAQWKSIAYNYPEFGLKPEGFRDYCASKGMLPK